LCNYIAKYKDYIKAHTRIKMAYTNMYVVAKVVIDVVVSVAVVYVVVVASAYATAAAVVVVPLCKIASVMPDFSA
jgi:hypothetical protein